MKVLWSIASIFGVTACVFLSGCAFSLSKLTLPSREAAPVIAHPILSGHQGNSHYALELPITNPGSGKLKVSIEIEGASSEILNPYPVSGVSAGQGTTVFKICDITQKRTEPILLKATWSYNSKTGISTFTIPPEQDNVIRQKNKQSR